LIYKYCVLYYNKEHLNINRIIDIIKVIVKNEMNNKEEKPENHENHENHEKESVNIEDIKEKYRHRTLINERYVFEKKIGSGSFGCVYRGRNVISEDKVAIKFEASSVEMPTLLWESKMLNHLVGIPGVVKLRYFGTEANKNIIVMDLYSHTLCEEIEILRQSSEVLLENKENEKEKEKEKEKESDNDSPNNDSPKRETDINISPNGSDGNDKNNTDLEEMDDGDNTNDNRDDKQSIKEEQCGKMPPHTKKVTEYLIEMLSIISKVHDAGVVHRDIKPENFMFSVVTDKGNIEKKLNIIDFGLSRFYMKGDKHVANTCNKSIVGTLRYISKHVHEGDVYSRRDDIISILYVAIYLLKGKLAWSGIITKKGDKRTKEELVYDKKMNTTSEQLCSGLPYLYQKLIDYAYTLEFEDKPDYLYMIRQCKNLLKVI
jgi:serine/threonine protein kinase